MARKFGFVYFILHRVETVKYLDNVSGKSCFKDFREIQQALLCLKFRYAVLVSHGVKPSQLLVSDGVREVHVLELPHGRAAVGELHVLQARRVLHLDQVLPLTAAPHLLCHTQKAW